ncbi:MAG: UDP-3-O-(3-hydroxymyristoyl)glucosamine N-acyltransferase [Bacteroidota bacterium]
MQLSAKELAAILNGVVEGDAEVQVNRPSKIEEGGAGTISFLGNPKYEAYAYTTTASILLVSHDFEPSQALPEGLTLLRVDDVYKSIASLLEQFGQSTATKSGVSPYAFVHESATVAEEVFIDTFTIVGAGASIGKGSQIHGQVYIGKNARIGEGVVLYPGVRVLDDCVVGDRCVFHPNVVIGGDGFGFAPDENGHYQKIAQIGNVIIESDVEIGAGTTIDRATMGSTRIGRGAKLDNLIQIGHNVEVGEDTVIAAQAGIAGSTKIGNACRIGGQVGFSGHISIADGTQIQAQSGLPSSIKEPNTAVFGSPAIPYKDYIRSYAVFKKLPALYKQIHQLEKELEALKAANSSLPKS